MATPAAPTELWTPPKPTPFRVTRLRVIALVAVLAVLGIVLAFTVFTGPTAAQRDCNAMKAFITSQGHTEPASAYRYCLHDPNRAPASFWQN
jgi:hypothetical protein